MRPVDFNAFSGQAAALKDSANLFVSRDGDSVQNKRALKGLSILSISARRAENRSAVGEFISSIQPFAEKLSAQTWNMLAAKLDNSQPLRAGDVKAVAAELRASNLRDGGVALVHARALPAHEAGQFQNFCQDRGLTLDDDAQKAAALKAYYAEVLTGVKLNTLSRETADPSELKVLHKLKPPRETLNEAIARDLDEHGLDGFQARLPRLYHQAWENDRALLDGCRGIGLGPFTARENGREIFEVLREGRQLAGADGIEKLYLAAISANDDLSVPGNRAELITTAAGRIAAAGELGDELMRQLNLPVSFKTALGNHPEVIQGLKERLAQDPGSGVLPDRARLNQAFSEAVTAFAEKHAKALESIKDLAGTTVNGVEIRADELPRYVNALISGEEFADYIADPHAPIQDGTDPDFLRIIDNFGRALDSAGFSVKGDFGTDDLNKVNRTVLQIQMAKRGVDVSDPEFLHSLTAKLGPLSNNLCTAFEAASSLKIGDRNFRLQAGLVFHAIENTVRAGAAGLSDEVLRQEGLLPSDMKPNEPGYERKCGELWTAYFESNLQAAGDPKLLPQGLRDYANRLGASFAPQDPEIAKQQAQVQAQRVKAANLAHAGIAAEALNSSKGQARLFEIVDRKFQRSSVEHIDRSLIDLKLLTDYAAQKLKSEAGQYDQKQLGEQDFEALTDLAVTEFLADLELCLQLIEEQSVQLSGMNTNLTSEDLAKLPYLSSNPNFSVVRELFDRGSSFLTLEDLALPNLNASSGKLAEHCSRICQQFYKTAQQSAVSGALGFNEALSSISRMYASLLSPQQKQDLISTLSSPDSLKLAGLVKHLAGLEPDLEKALFLNSYPEIMQSLLNAACEEQGIEAAARLDEAPELADYEQLPRDSQPMLGVFASGQFTSRGIISEENKVLSRIAIDFQGGREAVLSLMEKVCATAGREGDILAYLLASSAQDLNAALKDKGTELDNAEIFRIVTGQEPPQDFSLDNENFGARLYQYMDKLYTDLAEASGATTQPGSSLLMLNSTLGVKFTDMVALIRPSSEFEMSKSSVKFEMGSLADVPPNKAYGLCRDFPRRDPNSHMQVENAEGNKLFEIDPPGGVRDEMDTDPANPAYQSFMKAVRGITHSEGQFARVMQCFTQAPLIYARSYAPLFPGRQLSEHGGYPVTVRAQADGTVLADIHSGAESNMDFRAQIRIFEDGSHEFVSCSLSRRLNVPQND